MKLYKKTITISLIILATSVVIYLCLPGVADSLIRRYVVPKTLIDAQIIDFPNAELLKDGDVIQGIANRLMLKNRLSLETWKLETANLRYVNSSGTMNEIASGELVGFSISYRFMDSNIHPTNRMVFASAELKYGKLYVELNIGK